MNWLISLITGGLGSLVSGVLTPWLDYKSKTADVDLQGFKTATGADGDAYKAWLAYRTQVESIRAGEVSWFGPKLCLMMVALPACLHVGLVFLDSSFTFGAGHYGSLGIAQLPAAYFDFEQRVIEFLFGVAVAGPMASAASAWLHRR